DQVVPTLELDIDIGPSAFAGGAEPHQAVVHPDDDQHEQHEHGDDDPAHRCLLADLGEGTYRAWSMIACPWESVKLSRSPCCARAPEAPGVVGIRNDSAIA